MNMIRPESMEDLTPAQVDRRKQDELAELRSSSANIRANAEISSARALHALLDKPIITMQAWQVAAGTMAVAAAIDTDYKAAASLMKTIGESVGAVGTRVENHMHLHDVTAETVRELPVSEVEARMKELQARLATPAEATMLTEEEMFLDE